MTYGEYDVFEPSTFLYCLPSAIRDPACENYHATIPYLRALRSEITTLELSNKSPEMHARYGALIKQSESKSCGALGHIVDVLLEYARSIERYFHDILCETKLLTCACNKEIYMRSHAKIVSLVRSVQNEVDELRGSDDFRMLKDDGG
jgi:hypothetical protein